MEEKQHIKKNQSRKSERSNQQGGGSDWSSSFYAYFMSPAELTRYTLKYIDQAPMFNPLEFNTVIPTGTSGIKPTGVYLANHPSADIKSADYNLKEAVCGTTMSGGGNCCGARLPGRKGKKEDQSGGSIDYSFYHPSVYPGNKPLGSPEYIGVSCGASPKGCGSCGMMGPGAVRPFGVAEDGTGRLERCQVHYTATNSYGPGCQQCENGVKPSIWNDTAFPNPYKCGSTGLAGGPCGGCGSCPPCLSAAKYHYSPGCKYQAEECQELYNRLSRLDQERLWGLCRDNYVRIYDIDKETGRLTPKNKARLCKRLAKRLCKTGKTSQVALF